MNLDLDKFAKCTKGPWRVGESYIDEGHLISGVYQVDGAVLLCRAPVYTPLHQWELDGALIAAAPDLLLEVKKLQTQVKRLKGQNKKLEGALAMARVVRQSRFLT